MLAGIVWCYGGSVPNLCVKGGNAARIAWLKDGLVKMDAAVKTGVVNNKFTGDWVVMTVSVSNGIQKYTICQGVPVSGNYANKVITAYFTNKNYKMAVLLLRTTAIHGGDDVVSISLSGLSLGGYYPAGMFCN